MTTFTCIGSAHQLSFKSMNNRRLELFHLQQAIRNFFNNQGFMDVMTPPLVENPGMETHIHPFRLIQAQDKKILDQYLHTSPEFHMKELLADGFSKIFTLSYCFRNEPFSDNHREQFVMLEWYRAQSNYFRIMDDTENLFSYCLNYLKTKNVAVSSKYENVVFHKKTISEIFREVLDIEILDYLEASDLRKLIHDKFKDVPLPREELSWDDYYFLLFLNKVEPALEKYPYILLYEFPYHLSALSTLKESDPRVCERFEVYCNGIELCNCFNELTDFDIQKKRFDLQRIEKKKLYGYELPKAKVLYDSLERGLPESGGIALGVERLLKVITDRENPFY